VIPVVERTSVDGVTVLRSDAAFGRYAAALVFRVGRYDETLPSAGITHLVEHLTLRRHHKAAYHFNAQVTGLFTTFLMDSAEPGDVAGYIATVCQGLAADHSDGLDQEKRVLLTEAASRGGGGALGTCLIERYGAAGPGLAGFAEYGLHRLDWAQIQAWRRRWFTAENAALWISGPIPPGLNIALPAGQRLAPSPAPALGVPLPGFVVTRVGGVGMSLVAPQSAVLSVAMDVLEQRCTQVLRHERGVSYGINSTADRLDARLMHGWLAADALAEQVPSAAHAMLATAEEVAANGVSPEEIADYARRMREAFESVSGAPVVLHRHAERVLLDSGVEAVRQPAQVLRSVSDVDGSDVGAVVGQLMKSLVVAVPQHVPAVIGRMPSLPRWSAATGTVDGRTVTSLDEGSALTVGDAGVTLTQGPEGHHVTVRYARLAAMLCWNDEKRTLIGADGFSLLLDPGQWPDGGALVASVADRVPPGLRVPLRSPGPRTARPATKPATKPATEPGTEPPAQATPVPPARKMSSKRIAVIRAAWLAVMLSGIVLAVGGDVGGGLLIVAGAIGFYRWNAPLRRWVRKRVGFG
jgi:zinc protease